MENNWVSDWTEGYVAEIDYTFGYYSELNPLRMAVPFLNVGLAPPAVATACELGFGQGISVNIHAAASDVLWHGTDFNPAQAGFARSLAAMSGSGGQPISPWGILAAAIKPPSPTPKARVGTRSLSLPPGRTRHAP